MSRNGSGVYTLPAGNPVVTGTTISSTVHNNTMTDLATEMTNSVDKDGQTVITGTIDHNGNQIILDAASTTSITADTNNLIDIEISSVDAIKFGWQSVADTGFVSIDPAAFTADATENTHRLALLASNAITIPTGTTALVSGLYVAEPNITATGTVTNAATVYIAGAPTEGATNYSLLIGSGDLGLGTLTLGSGSITDSSGAIDFGNEALSTTGTLGIGAITTSEDLTFSNANPEIFSGDADGTFTIAAGATALEGSNMVLFGLSHATLASDVWFRTGSTLELGFDSSANIWDFQANAITTTGSISGATGTFSGGSSGATASINADELIVENSVAGGLSILTPDNATGSLFFGSPSDNVGGFTQWNYTDSKLTTGTNKVGASSVLVGDNSVINLTLSGASGSELATFAGDVTLSDGDLTVSAGFLNLGAPAELTIATGAVTATSSYHIIDTEADAASDALLTINGGSQGDILYLSSANSARSVVVTDNTGNLRLAGGDFTMDNVADTITLLHNGANWLETSRAGNA